MPIMAFSHWFNHGFYQGWAWLWIRSKLDREPVIWKQSFPKSCVCRRECSRLLSSASHQPCFCSSVIYSAKSAVCLAFLLLFVAWILHESTPWSINNASQSILRSEIQSRIKTCLLISVSPWSSPNGARLVMKSSSHIRALILISR